MTLLLVFVATTTARNAPAAWSATSDTTECALRVRVDEFFRNGRPSTRARATNVRVFVIETRAKDTEPRANCAAAKGTTQLVDRKVLDAVSKGTIVYLTKRETFIEFERNGTRTYGMQTTFTRIPEKTFVALTNN